jgi:RNA polymerase sigma-70 factor (ECF subfamily)
MNPFASVPALYEVNLTDCDLLAHAAAGDTRAFDTLVVRHAADLHRFVGSLGVHGADADDVLQDTFLAAWRGAGTYRGDGSARAWLFSVARNALRHSVRRRVGEPDQFAPLEAIDTLEAIAEAAGWGSDADSRERDTADLVRTALARLAPADREILVLRDVEGLSGEETAEALSLSLAGMKSRLHRARLRLAALVRALEHAPDPISATRAPDPRTGHDARGASHA